MTAPPNGLWYGLMTLGLCAGVLSGTLGIGSGTLLVPALVLLFGFPQKSAQGMCLAVMVPMVIVGAIRYKLNPEIPVHIPSVVLIALGAVLGAILGTELAARLPSHVLRKLFAIFLVVVAARMILSRHPSTDTSQRAGGAEHTAPTALTKGDPDSGTNK